MKLQSRFKQVLKNEIGPFADGGHTTQTNSPMALWMTVTERPQKEIYGPSNSQVRALLSKPETTRGFVGRRLLGNTGVLSSDCSQTIPVKGLKQRLMKGSHDTETMHVFHTLSCVWSSKNQKRCEGPVTSCSMITSFFFSFLKKF